MKIVINGAGIAVRNALSRLLAVPHLGEALVRLGLNDDVDLPEYEFPG